MIGCTGALVATLTDLLVYKLKVDDPVGVIPVHGACAVWGLMSVGMLHCQKTLMSSVITSVISIILNTP